MTEVGIGPALPARRETAARLGIEWRGYALLSPALAATSFVFAASMVILAAYSFRAFRDGRLAPGHTADTWTGLLGSSYFWSVVERTMKLGGVTVAVTALIGYPMALALHRLRRHAVRYVAYFLIFSPLMTSVVVRSYGWE